jgi:hypothetical protein
MPTTRTPKETATIEAQRESAMPATRAPGETATVGPEQAFAVAERARGALGASAMLALQSAAGNRAVVGLGQTKAGPSATAGAQAMDHRAAFAGLEAEGSAAPGRAVVQRTLASGGGVVVGREPARRSPGAPLAHAAVHAAAARGTTTPAQTLPFAASIQRVFGRHDISGIRAHIGGDANASAEAMGAEAYAVGDHVVLPPGTDLFTAAHEAAHVVQQRGGVRPAGGVGSAGDAYEQHADAVAKLVVEGKFAEALLDKHASGGAAPAPGAAPVQHKLRKFGDIKPVGEKGGFSWREHSTQFDDRDGAQPPTTAYGLGAPLDRAHEAPDGWTVLPTYGLPDPSTTEATSVDVPRLGPIVAPQPAAAPTMRPLNLGLAIQTAAKRVALPVYQEAQLLPARFGGSPGAHNLVALPAAAKDDLEVRGHGMIDRLVGKAGAWIAYQAMAVPATEKIDTTDIHYTGAVRVAWAELDESGGLIDGTHGQFQVGAPKPSEYAAGTTMSVPASAPLKLGAHDNRARSPAPRHDNTALTWRTEITWGATHACGDGTLMEARRLGPDHKQGDEPAHKDKKKVTNPTDHYIWDQRTTRLSSAAGGRAYIAGHLLNHHVGGPGNDARNLAAIPSDVNSKMAANVEGPVKDLVNHKHAWLYYKAEVNHTPDAGSGNVWYANQFSFQWHQLDARTGEAVPGTAGNVSYAIQAPSVISANKAKAKQAPATFTPTLSLPMHDDVQPQTAVTMPAFDELVLEESSALRPLLIYQQSLIDVLRKMRLNPQFTAQSDVELSTSIANVMARYKPEAAETAAWTKIAALDVEIAALDPRKQSDLRSFAAAGDALRDAIGDARTKRGARMGKLAAAVQMKLARMHDKDFAIKAWNDFDGAVKSYTEQIEQAEAVALTLVEYARKASTGALTDKRNILDAANALRAWLGQPPLDDNTDTQPLPSQLIGDTVSIANQSFDYGEAPRSPGEWYEYSKQHVTQNGPTDLKGVKSTVVHDANAKKIKLEIPSHPSNTLPQLIGLATTRHATWPGSVPVDAEVGGSVHAIMSGIVRNIDGAGYESYLHDPAIRHLYEQDIENTQRYLAFLNKYFGIT